MNSKNSINNKITIKDVANHANVAISTVSRVINDMDRVSDKTRDRVNASIAELGYVRNDLAAAIKTGSANFIVVIVPDLVNEFYTSVIRGVEQVASAHGYRTLVSSAGNRDNRTADVLDDELYALVDGIIVVPSDSYNVEELGFDKPFVVVDRIRPQNNCYSVSLDNYKGARELVEYLINKGHERISFISGYSPYTVLSDRIRGYVDTLENHGLEVNDDYLCLNDWHRHTGYEMTEKLMQLKTPPTAIFAGNNRICIGCADYFYEHGIEIGKDISLVQFDDFELSQYIGNGITCISHPTFEMGSKATEMLLRLLGNPAKPLYERNVIMPVQLITRGSVADIS